VPLVSYFWQEYSGLGVSYWADYNTGSGKVWRDLSVLQFWLYQ